MGQNFINEELSDVFLVRGLSSIENGIPNEDETLARAPPHKNMPKLFQAVLIFFLSERQDRRIWRVFGSMLGPSWGCSGILLSGIVTEVGQPGSTEALSANNRGIDRFSSKI